MSTKPQTPETMFKPTDQILAEFEEEKDISSFAKSTDDFLADVEANIEDIEDGEEIEF